MSNEYKEMKKWEVAKLLEEGNKLEAEGMEDGAYCYFDAENQNLFRLKLNGGSTPMNTVWRYTKWRIRKYIPEKGEICIAWNDGMKDCAVVCVSDEKGKVYTPGYRGVYDKYAPFDGTPPKHIAEFAEMVKSGEV